MLKLLREILGLLDKNQRKKLINLQVSFFLMSLFQMIGIASFGPFMILVTDTSVLKEDNSLTKLYLITGLTEETFVTYSGITVLLLILGSTLLSLRTNWRVFEFSANTGMKLSTKLFNYYLSKDWLFHTSNSSSKLLKQILIETRRLGDLVISPLIQLIGSLMFIFIVTVSITIYNPYITIFGFSIMAVSYFIMYRLSRSTLRRNGQNITNESLNRTALLTDGFGAIREIIISKKQRYFINRFDQSSMSFARSQATNALIGVGPKFFMELVAFASIVVVVLLLYNESSDGFEKAIPVLSVFALISIKLLPTFQSIFSNVAKIKGNLASLQAVKGDLIESKPIVLEPAQPSESLYFKHEIEFSNVTYQYPGERSLVLKGVNFKIQKNQTVGIVGFSGSGKSTISDLIAGIITPSSGKILVDSVDINQRIHEWQENISFVSQSIFLLNANIKDNIVFGIEEDEIDYGKLDLAIKNANLLELIDNLPEGIETQVGERGVQLSGGQRQRIGIARALYRNTDVLIFDEATSSLDSITENQILDSINNFIGTKTIIMIAHRLTTLVDCDCIMVLDEGRVVSSGTYNELLTNDKYFQKLARGIKEKL